MFPFIYVTLSCKYSLSIFISSSVNDEIIVVHLATLPLPLYLPLSLRALVSGLGKLFDWWNHKGCLNVTEGAEQEQTDGEVPH